MRSTTRTRAAALVFVLAMVGAALAAHATVVAAEG